jgi:3-phenylpropionate/trans-cinnamate dioxygenase ferredoxin subunit
MSGGKWLDVAAADDIPANTHEILETDDEIIAVFNIEGEFFAIEDVCTHDGEELTGGPVEGDQIICPRHGARFCIRTGRALTPPAYEDVQTFPVRVRAGRVEVEVE